MENLNNLNDVLVYIEENLLEEIDFAIVDRIAGWSSYHFQRMFFYLAQMSIHEYIKRRRLSLAALDCVQIKGWILDIAIKYGFQSNDSFTRTFVSCHDITPSKLRKDKQKLNIYPILSFQLTVKGSSAMNVKIIEKEAFNLVGISKRVPIVFNGVNPAIVEMVKSLDEHKIKC